MNQKEKEIIQSISNKIKEYEIQINLNKLLEYASGKFLVTTYNDKSKEVVDTNIEYLLCKMSPVYFLSKYGFIDFPGMGVLPFNLYYFQKEILKDCFNYKKLVFNKVRQCGVSTLLALYSFWRANFNSVEVIDVVSIKQSKSKQFVEKISSTRKNLPVFLTTPILKDNTEELSFANGSKIISESQSVNAGRSDSLSLLVLDEAAHYQSEKMVRSIVASATPTLNKTDGQMMVVSTPNRTNGPGAYFYEQVQNLQLECSESERLIVIDYWEVPDEDFLDGHKKGYNELLNKFISLDYYNKPDIKFKANEIFLPLAENKWKENAWLKKQHDDLGDIVYKQEILHDFVVSGQSVFNDVSLKRVKESVKEPAIRNSCGGKHIEGVWIWERPEKNSKYIMGVDVATGTGNDFSSAQVVDRTTMKQVCEYKGQVSTKIFSYFLKSLGRYYNNAYIIIESNSIGEAVFNELYYDEDDPYENMFAQKKTRNGVIRMTGFETNVKTRALLTNELIDYVSNEDLFQSIGIYSKRFYMELLSFVWKNGRAIHEDGAHDDTIIAFALILYLKNKINDDAAEGMLFFDGDRDQAIRVDSDENLVYGDEEELNEKFKEHFGMDKEDYDWMVS